MTASPRTAALEIGVAAHALVDGVLIDHLEIDGADGHHLQRVRRLRVGEHVTVADGAGTWRRYCVAAVGDGSLGLDALGSPCVEVPPARAVTIAPALSKGTKLETIAVHLTECGVQRIAPVVTARSVVRLDATGAERLHARLTSAVRGAAMQSRRSRLPVVEPVAPLAGLRVDGALLVAAIDGAADAPVQLDPTGAATVVTGPEGGLDATERAALTAMGARDWCLGPFVLRAETAPLAAAIALLL